MYAYYCLHKLHMLPRQYLALDEREKAFIMAAIDVKAKNEKKELDKMKR